MNEPRSLARSVRITGRCGRSPRHRQQLLTSQPFARHPPLPLGPDRAVTGGDDVGRRDLRGQREALAEDAERQEEPAGRECPLERRLVRVVVEERGGDASSSVGSFPIQSGWKAARRWRLVSSTKLASGSGTQAASQTWWLARSVRAAAGRSGPEPEWASTTGAATASAWRRMRRRSRRRGGRGRSSARPRGPSARARRARARPAPSRRRPAPCCGSGRRRAPQPPVGSSSRRYGHGGDGIADSATGGPRRVMRGPRWRTRAKGARHRPGSTGHRGP
jgi:hypothetical protein